MATLEELTTEATAEIEAAKPLYKQVNNERLEFDSADYDQAITDLANSKCGMTNSLDISKHVKKRTDLLEIN